MKISVLILPLAALALVPAAVQAEETPDKQEQADAKAKRNYIAFPNHGGVRDWRANDRDTIYFQDRQKRWFKAELAAPSIDLPSATLVGIDTSPGNRLDRWSAIYVNGQRILFLSFEAIEGKPPPRKKKQAKDAEAAAKD